MATITVPMQFPKAMAPFIENEDQTGTYERNAMILYPFIQNLTISYGRAAEILGVHKYDWGYYASYLNMQIHLFYNELNQEELLQIWETQEFKALDPLE